MKLSDVFTASAVAAHYTEAASNAIPYLGEAFFPSQKKTGLDLKWIKGNKGLPVSLAPAAFDTKAKIRDRIGIRVAETEMPFFRESMIVTEKDEQEIARAQDSNDPYAQEVLDRIFGDSDTLLSGAAVVPERMRMQLLAPKSGDMKIAITADGVSYDYDYDPNGAWKAAHYKKITTAAKKWSAASTCDPLADLEEALDAQEAASGNRPTTMLMSLKTFNYMKAADKVRSAMLAQNATANINVTTSRVKQLIKDELNLDVIIYTKKYKNEAGVEANFYADDILMLIGGETVGKTWYGTTPEERSLMSEETADVSIVETGVAISVTRTTVAPINTITTASEIVLPSFEAMDDCYALEVA